MSSYRKLARKQALRLGVAVAAMVGGMTVWQTAVYADGATDIQKMDAANAGAITRSGDVWTVVPDKVEGDLATNAFSKFILNQNNVVNLQMYKGGATANTLVNMVQGRIDIRGTVNVLKNATTIGGNVFFLSPEGMAVGRTGVINAGSITALTPSTDWFNDHLRDNHVKVTAADMDALKAGTIPLNADGSIVIDGQLNAQSGIHLGAPAITVGSAASTAAQLTSQKDLNFAALVNAGSTSAGLGTLTAATGAGGDIVLAAASNRLNSTTDDVPKYANPLSGSKNEIKAELTVGKSARVTGDQNIALSSYAEHTADQSEAFGGTSSNTSAQLLGQIVKTTAHTTVNGTVTADGRLSATAKAKNIASEAGPLSNAAGLADEVAGVIAVNVDPSYMIMGSEATVKIGADAALTAKGADVTVTQDGKTVVQERALTVGADARSSVDAGATTSKIKFANIKHTNAVPAMAVAYAKAQSAANVNVEGDLTAEQGSVDVHAKSREDLIAAAHAKTTQLGAGADSTQIMNVAVLVARGNNDAQVKIGQGAAVTAEKQADITADATTKLETSASASGKENSLLNVAVNVTKQTSAAHTEVRGAVTGKTAANIYAHNTQLKNSVEASTAAGKSGMVTYFSNAAANTNTVTGLTQKIKNVIGGIRSKIGFPSDGLSSPTELDKLGEKISLGGAVNVLNEEQQAHVLLAPHAVIRSDGAVKIDANSTIRGTHVRAQSAVNSQTDPNWYLTKDGKTEKVQAGKTEETQGMGSFAVNVANVKNTAGVTTLAAEESGTSYAPNITGKTVDVTADGHILYTNIDDMISELRASFAEFKQHCAAFQGAHAGTLTAAQDKADAYLAKCDNDPAYIVSKEGLKEAKELAAAIKAVADVLKEDVTVPANLAERALAFADPSNYLTFQASAKFSGKGATQENPDAEQAKIAGAAGVNFADVDNHAAVVLGRGTKVTAADEVTVAASSKKQLVTLVGAPAWQAGADIAIGGNIGITVGDTTADTIVAEGVEITGRKAAIKATNSYDGIHLAIAAGKGGKIGFQGMANYVGGTSGAVTSVDDEAKITAAAAAQMNALNTTNITNIAGSAVLGTGAAIGLSAALNNIAQTSIAAIADNDAAGETPQDKTAEQRTEKQIRAAQKRAVQPFGDVNAADLYGTAAKKAAGAVQAETLDVHAEQKGLINAAAAAGAIATGDDTSEKGGIFDKIGQTVTTGKNMVGNGITKIDNKLQDLVGSSLKKQAEKKTVPINAVKNLGFNQKQPPFTLDLAGSASVNLSKVTTAAEMKGANVTLTKNAASPAAMKNLTVSAQDSSFTGAWGGALAVTWKTTTKSQNEDSANAGIAGAASVNVQRHRDVLALMSDNRIKGADSIENVAVQKGATVAAALGLSVMKTSGKTVTSTAAPVSLTYNEGGSVTTAEMRDNYVNAAADGSVLAGAQKTALSNRAVSSNTQVSGGVSAGLVFGSKSSNAVGAVVAVSNLRNDVHADITQTRKDTGALRNIGALTNEAVSGMTQIGAAIGVGAASGSKHAAAVTGSFAVNNFANKTAAQLTRVTLTADSANVRADDKQEAGAYQEYLEERGIETSGDKYQEDFAKGKSNSSLAVDQDGNLTHSGGSTIVTAAASISAAAGSSAATAAGIGVGVGVIKNDFTAGVSGSDLELKGAQGLNVESVADTRAINVAAGVAGSGGIAAAGSASVIATNNETSAIVKDSTIKAQKLQANALTKSLLVNVAGQISVSAGGAGVAAGLATAVNMIDNNTTAALRGGRLTLSHDGIVNLNAQNIGGIEALTAGVAAGTQAAVSGAISVNVGKNDTRAEIAQYEVTKGRMVDAEIRGAKSVRVTTLDQTRQDAAVGGVSASTQGGAVGASVAFNALLGQQNTARISGAKIRLAEGGMATVNAVNQGELNTVALNVAGSGGSVAFAGAAAVADVDQDTTAEIVSSDIEAEAGKTAGDVTVQADGKLTARTFAIVGSGSSEGAAIGAGVAVNLLDADTNAVISGGKIHAANVITDAKSDLDILNIGMGVAASSEGVAVSGSVAVNKIDNDTRAKITDGAKVTARKNAVVTAASDDRIQNYSGQLTASAEGAAAGVSVSTNIIGSHTDAEISGRGTEAISHTKNTDAATTVKDGLDHGKLYNAPLTLGTLTGLDGLSAGRKENTYRGVAVSASATHTENSFLVNAGVTGMGAVVSGTVNTNVIGGTTSAKITDATAKAAGADVSVRADDATNSGALVGTVSVAGEGAALGTGSSINLINRTTQAAAERSTITAKNAAIDARSGQGIAALTMGVSFADEFGAANSNNFVRMEQHTNAALTDSKVDVSGLSVTADNLARLHANALTKGLAGYGVGAGVGTAVLLDRSTTEADVAGTTVSYADDQGETLVRARNEEHLTNAVYSLGAAGLGGVGASIGGGDVRNTVKAAVRNSSLGYVKVNQDDTKAETAAKKITVSAENDLNFDEQSGTYGVGAVGASVGVAVNNFKSTVESVVTGSTLHAREAADITAHDAKNIRQLATNGAAGIAAVGLNIMVMNVGADLKDSYAMDEGSEAKKQSADLKQHTDKEKAQEQDAAARSQEGLSYVSSDNSGNALAEKTAPSTEAKASARAERSHIRADGNGSAISLSARDTMNITQLTMQAGVGGIAVGGAAGIVESRANAEVVTSDSKLRADTITLDSAKDGAATLKIYQGAAGAGAFNAAYGGLNMGGRNDLALSGTEMHGKTITGKTRDESTGKVEIIGVAAATGNGANILVGNAAHDGVQTMRVANSTLTADGDLTLSMTRAAKTADAPTLQTITKAAASGITFAGNGIAALARETGGMTMHLAKENTLAAAGALTLRTDNRADVRAETGALSASIIAAATATHASASFGTAENAYRNRILVGVEDQQGGRTDGENTLSGKTVTIAAETNAKESAQLKALSAAGSVGVQVSTAKIGAYSDAKTLLSSRTNYRTAVISPTSAQPSGVKELQISTKNIHTQDLDARGIAAGGLFATATNYGAIKNVLHSDTTAYGTGSGSILHNAALTTDAEAVKKGKADGSGGALVAISPIAAWISDDTTLSAKTKLMGTWNLLGALDAKASTYDNTVHDVDALQAAIVGGSGTRLTKTLAQNAAVSVENAQIETVGAQYYEAKNAFSHADKDAASGYGAGTLNAGAVSSNMTETAKVTFTSSTAKTTGYAGITAQSLTEGTSKTTGIVKSAGVIPFTMMKGSLGVTYDNTVDAVNSHLATAKADANIALAARDNTEIRYEMNADTQGGLAGTASAALTSNITRGNTVRVDGASTLFSSNDVNLYTGRGIDPQTGERNLGTFKLSLLADATNRTAIPLRTAPKLDNKMKQANTVDIACGAHVESVRHANLSAVPGYTQAYESATEYTVWSGKGAQGSLTTTADGSKIKNEEAHNTVRVDGSVTAGIHNRLSMNIRQKSPGMSEAKTKELTAKLAGMTTAQKEALAQKTDATGEERLLRDIYMLSEGKGALSADEAQWLYGQLVGAIDVDITDGKEWLDKNAIRYQEFTLNNPYLTEYNNLMRAYSHVKKGSTEGNNLWTTIARLKESMKAEGFVDGDTVLSSRTTIGLVLPDLAVSGGDVNIEADTVSGTGSLRAKGAPVVNVRSAAERRLIVQDVKISDAGGRVRLGEADLTGKQFGGEVHTDKKISDSSITIHSTAQASDADIELHGDIITPGTITVKTANSSIRSTNRSNMRAAQIHVEAPNGAVSQSSPQGTVFIGGDPLARFSRPGPLANWIQKIVSDNLEAGKTEALEFKNAKDFYATILLGALFIPGLREDAEQLFKEASRHDATWVAGKDISIAARNVNINGLIQSGYPSYKIKLDASANDAIAAADRLRTEERLRVSDEQTYWDETAADGRGAWAYRPAVYYNAKEGYLFTDAMETGGGNVTITGALSSTSNPIITKDGCVVDGRGRILARGGESDISIDTSAVTRDLHLGAITNRAGGGRVLLSDRNTGKTTEYLSNGTYRSYTIGTEEKNRGDFEDAPTENGMAQYAPKAGLTYNWTGGRSGKKTQTTYSYGERFLANGHWSTGDVGKNITDKNIEDGTVRVSKMESDGDILPNGVYFGTGDTSKYHWVDGSVYESTGEKFPNPPAVTKYYGKWQEKNGKRVYNDDGTPHMINTWWGERLKYGIYFHQWNEVTTKGTSNTYHIAADKKIGVDFLAGDGSGNVSVHTNGSLILNGGIRNISNNTYAVDLKSDAGRIESNLGRNGIVYTNNLTAHAANGITLVQSAADAANPSKLALNAGSGAIDLTSQRGDVQLVKGYAGADVGIGANGSIVGAAPGSDPAVKGANITLTSTGAIDLPIVASGRVDVSAGGNIKLMQQQTGGDLKVGSIQSTNGDVDLTAEGGAIVDALPEESRLSDAAERMERWRSLGLTHADDSANESVKSAAAAKAERLKGLETLGKAAARSMSAEGASDADVEKLYADYQALSEAYRNDAAIQAARKAYADELKASHEAGWSAEDAYARTIGMAEQAFFTQKGIVKTEAHAQTEVDKARTFIRDYKTLAQSDSYGWSANGLRYAIQKSVINATPGQIKEVKTPNIIGRNITLTAGRNKGIGEDGSKIRIANADLLKEQNLITLSNARAGEMRWTADGVEVTHTRPVKVQVREGGKVNLTGDQRVYVVSKESALNLGTVASKGDVYLQGTKGIYGGDTAITAARLSLYGGSGGIGTADKHLRINATGVLDANAAGGIYIKQDDTRPLTIQAVGAGGDVVLTASKGMRMTTEEGKTGGYIKGAHVTLKSTENSLGTAADGIRIAANSLLYADAGAHDVHIASDDNGTLLIGALKGKNISVHAVKGVEMKEDEDKAAKIEAEENADIASGEGAIALAQGAVAAKKVSLSAKNGITQSKNGSIKTNALGVKSDGAVRLLGTQNTFPALTLTGIAGDRVGGSVHIVNTGGMRVSPLDVAGDLTIAQKGALTMGGDVRADGTLTIETDEQLAAQNITAGSAATLNAGTALTAHNITAGGNAVLNAGADLTANDVTAGGSLNAKAKNITANNVNVTDNTNITAGVDFKVHDVNVGGELNAKGQTITAENIKSTGKTALTATTDSITAKNLRAGGTLDAVAKTNLTVDTVTGKSKIALTAQTGNLKATGAVHTDTDAVLTAGKDVTLRGAFSAKQHVSFTAGQNATLNDKTDVGGTLTANVGRDLVTNGAVTTGQNFVVTVGNNLTTNETVTAGRDFTANVGNNVTTNNIVTTGGNLAMKGTNDLTAHAAVLSHGGATLDAQNVKLNADLTADKNLTITATKNIFTKAGTNLYTKSDGRLKAHDANLDGDVRADGTLTIETDDKLTAKNITVGKAATLNAGTALTAHDINAGNDAVLNAGADLTANDVTAGGSLSAKAKNITANNVSVIGNTIITAGADFKVHDVTAGGDLTAKGQNINANNVTSTGKTALTATADSISAKNLSADGTLDAVAKTNLTVDTVTGKSKIALTAQTGNLKATGAVHTDTDAALTAGRDVTLAGTFSAGSAQLAAGENAMLGGTTDVGETLTAKVGRDLVTNGAVTTGQNFVATVGNNLTTNETVTTGSDFTATAGNDFTSNDKLAAGQNLVANVGNDFTTNGAVTTGSDFTATVGNNVITNNIVTTGGNLVMKVTNDLTAHAAVLSHGTAQLDAQNVNLNANLSSDKNLAITAKNNIFTKEGANLYSKSDGRLKAHTADLGGDIRADGTLTIETDEQLTAKNITAGNATLKAGAELSAKSVNVGGDLNAKAKNITANNVTGKGNAVLTADKNVTLEGAFSAKNNAVLTAGETATLGGKTDVGETLTANVGRDFVTNGAVTTGKELIATVGNDAVTNGIVTTNGALKWNVGNDFTVNAAVFSHGTTTIDAQNVKLSADLMSDKNLTITAKNNIFTKEGTNLSTKSDGRLKAHTADLGGDVHADGTLTIETDEHLAAKNITAGGNATLNAGAELSAKDVNVGGDLNAKAKNITANNVTGKGNAVLTADKNVTLEGAFSAKNNAVLTAGETATLGGKTDVGETLTANVGRDFVTNGAVTTGKELIANVGNDAVTNGIVTTNGALKWNVGNDFTVNAAVFSHGTTTIDAQNVNFNADFASDKNLTITAKNNIFTKEGTNLSTKSDGKLKARTADLGGDVHADGTLTIETDEHLAAKNITAGGNATLNAGAELSAKDVNVGGDLNAKAKNITANNVTGKGNAVLTADKDVTLAGAFSTKNNARLTAGQNAKLGGKTNVGETLTANVGRDFVTNGAVTTGKELIATVGNDLAMNDLVSAGGSASLTVGRNATLGGTLTTGGNFTVNVAHDLTVNDAVTTGADFAATVGNDAVTNGIVTTNGVLKWNVGKDLTTNAAVLSHGTTTIDAQNVNFNADFASDKNLTITAKNNIFTKEETNLYTKADGKLKAHTADLGGDVRADGTLTIETDEQLAAKNIIAGGDLNAKGVNINAHNISAGGNTTVNADKALTAHNITAGGNAAMNTGTDLTVNDVSAAGNTGITAGTNITANNVTAKGDTALTAGRTAKLHDVNAGKNLAFTTTEAIEVHDVTAGGNAAVTAGTNLIANDMNVGGDLNAKGQTITAENIKSTGKTALTATTDSITAKNLRAGGTLDAVAKTNLTVDTVTGKSKIALTAQTGNLRATGAVHTDTDAVLTAGQNATLGGKTDVGETLTAHIGKDLVTNGAVTTGKELIANVGNDLAMNDLVSAGGSASLTVGRNVTLDGALTTGGNFTANVAHDLTANDAVTTGADFAVTVGNDAVTNGIVTTNGALKWNVGKDLTTNAAVLSHGRATIDAQNVNFNADFASDKNLTITAKNNIFTKEGTKLSTKSDGKLKAHTADLGGDVRADGTLTIETDEQLAAQNITAGNATLNTGAELSAKNVNVGGNADITAGTNLTANDVSVGGDLNAKAKNITVSNVGAGGNATLNTGAELSAKNVNVGGNTDITAGTNLAAHDVSVGGDLNAQAQNITVTSVTGKGNAVLTADKDVTLAGGVSAKRNAQLTAGENMTLGGKTDVGETLTAYVGRDFVTNGAVTTGKELIANVGNDLAMNDLVSAGGSASLTVGRNATLDGTLTTGGNFTANVAHDLTANDAVTTGADFMAIVGNDAVTNGIVTTNGALKWSVCNDLTANAAVLSHGTTMIDAQNVNLNADLMSDKNLAITAKNNIFTKEGTNLSTKADGRLKAHSAILDGDVRADGTLTIETDDKLTAKNITAGNATLKAGAELSAKNVNVGGNAVLNAGANLTANDVSVGGDLNVKAANLKAHNITVSNAATLNAETALTAKNVTTGGNVNAKAINLAAHNISAGGNAVLNAGANLTANDVTVTGDTSLTAGANLTANNVTTGGNLTAQGGSDLSAKNIHARANATVTAGANLAANDLVAGDAAALHAGKAMDTGAISAGTVKLHADDGYVHAHGAITAAHDAAVSTGTQGAIMLEKTLTAGKNITLDTKRGDMLFGGDVRSKEGTITATIEEHGNIGQLGGAKISVEAAAKGTGYVTLTNKGTGDIDLHRVYADRDIRTSLEHGNIHVYEMNGALVAVVLKDPDKKMALENIIAERRMIVQGSDMNLDNIRVREGSDGLLSIEPAGARDDRPIANFTMGNLDLSGATGIRFERLWANNAKLKISGGRVRFDKLFIEGKADIAYAGQETSIYGTPPQIDGNVVTYWNDVNRNNPRTNKEGWTGMYLSFTGANRQESNGNLLSLSNYRFVYPQRENLVDFMGHALRSAERTDLGMTHISATDGTALAMQTQAEPVDLTTENATAEELTLAE